MTDEELARLKAIAFGQSELEFDQAFWSDGGTTVQALITEIEQLRGNLSLAEEGLASAVQELQVERMKLQTYKAGLRRAGVDKSSSDEPEASHYCIDCNEAHDPRTCGALKSNPARVAPAICGKPMPNGKGAGQCINVPWHEGECDDMPF